MFSGFCSLSARPLEDLLGFGEIADVADLPLDANDVHAGDSAVFTIRFEHNSVLLQLDKYENALSLNAFRVVWNSLSTNPLVKISGITLVGDASAEGTVNLNRKLGIGRAKAVAAHISEKYGVDYALFSQSVRPWLHGSSDHVNRPEHIDIENRACHIVLHYVREYESKEPSAPAITDNPASAGSAATASAGSTGTEVSADTLVAAPVVADTVAAVPAVPSLDRMLRLNTNLLYDVVTVANLGVEVGFCRHFSAGLVLTYSPWDIFRSDFKLRTLLFLPEVKYYIGPDFKGHYFGVEGHFGWYNVAIAGSPTRYQDLDGNTPLYGGGITYGYVLSFNRHWGMDFSIGVGYAHLKYDCFYNIPNGARYTAGERDWFGPTKAGVSIYYQF